MVKSRRSKEIILSAIRILISGYQNNNLSHSSTSCPLCIIYFDYDNYDKSGCCKCINRIFESDTNDTYGCVNRGIVYRRLSFNNQTVKADLIKNKYLAWYWQEVYNVLESTPASLVLSPTPEVHAKIKAIAEKSNTISLTV